MIGRLKGILLEKHAPDLLVDVQGVGYEVQVSMNTFFTLPKLGEGVTLHTHFVVREDAQQLFGFATLEERTLFRSLVKVSGVGPKMALALLSGMSVADFVRCVRSGDLAALTRVPGVGTKTGERLLVEMKDRVAKWGSAPDAPAQGDHQIPEASMQDEAESALLALGYKPQEATRMVARASKELGADADSEALIRAALKSVLKK